MTIMLAAERRVRILQEIDKNGQVKVKDLSEEWGVSRMTIHRDLTQLAEEGVVQRVFGGAISMKRTYESEGDCAMCGRRVMQRTLFLVNSVESRQERACCPHCGLMLLANRPDATSALAADFLYGRMINVRSAAFLVDSDVIVCCMPSILCFQQTKDAERFQKGFGGRVMDMDEAQAHLRQSMMIPT